MALESAVERASARPALRISDVVVMDSKATEDREEPLSGWSKAEGVVITYKSQFFASSDVITRLELFQ